MLILFQTADKKNKNKNKEGADKGHGRGENGPGQPSALCRPQKHAPSAKSVVVEGEGNISRAPRHHRDHHCHHHLARVGLEWCWLLIQSSFDNMLFCFVFCVCMCVCVFYFFRKWCFLHFWLFLQTFQAASSSQPGSGHRSDHGE